MRSKYSILILLVFVLSYGVAACNPSRSYEKHKAELIHERLLQTSIIDINQRGADNLLSECNIFIDKQEPVIVTSLVNIDDMRKSSAMGRMSSEIIANRLAQHGYKIQEIKMGRDIMINEPEGEFILSREMQQIGHKYNVQGFIVGTYAASEKRRNADSQVLIALRFVDTNNTIGCSSNYMIRDIDLEMWR